MNLYAIVTHGYGIFYRRAKTPAAARQRVCYAIFGPGYDGWEHEYWNIVKIEVKKGVKNETVYQC